MLFSRQTTSVKDIMPIISFILLQSVTIGDIRGKAEELIYDEYGQDKIIEFERYVIPSSQKDLIEKRSGMRYMFPHVY